MTARRKRLALSRASKKTKSKSMKEESRTSQDQNNINTEANRDTVVSPSWRMKRACCKNRDDSDSMSIVLMQSTQSRLECGLSHFQSAKQVAEWIFAVAKHRSMKVALNCFEQNEEVRDALLRRFHRWPETKILQATNRFQDLSQEAFYRCHEQVQLYLQNLRENLQTGAKALFWLDELQPLVHTASVPRLEARDVLLRFVDDIKAVDGFYQQLIQKEERLWTVLTLPLNLEPFFQGLSTLALKGLKVAARDAMQIFTMFAENYTASGERECRNLPFGFHVVASISALVPFEAFSLGKLDEEFREILSTPLAMMVHDWIQVVDQVIEILGNVLTRKWTLCERAPYEEKLEISKQVDLQCAFERLNYVLSTGQLYAIKKMAAEGSGVENEVLNVSILREKKILLVMSSKG